MVEPELSGDFATLMGWADPFRRLEVRANAETALDARTARQFGAEGIGLVRTEHMFFDDEPHRRRARDDPRRRRGRPAPALAKHAGRCSAATSSSSSGSCRACRSPSDCSIRPCTSSCRTRARTIEAVAEGHRARCRQAHAAGARSRRDQPHARASRLPAGRLLPGNLRDAGSRDHRGGPSRSRPRVRVRRS